MIYYKSSKEVRDNEKKAKKEAKENTGTDKNDFRNCGNNCNDHISIK